MDPIKLLGSLLGNNASGSGLMGSLLKGLGGGGSAQQAPPTQQRGGGLMGMVLKSVLGGSRGGKSLLGGLLGGGSQGGGGGLTGMLGSLLGGGRAAAPAQASHLFGESEAPPPQSDEDQATLLIRAMCNACKADGQIDAEEQKNIVGRLGDEIDEAEAAFLEQELNSPLDVQSFAREVPPEMAADVYAMSVMAIRVDTHSEAQYLRDLSQALGIDAETTQHIHQQLGAA